MKLTSRERIMRIYKNQEIDRPAIKMWGARYGKKPLYPEYDEIFRLAEEYSDMFTGYNQPFNLLCGQLCDQYISKATRMTDSPLWNERITTITTPKGPLRSVELVSKIGAPGYFKEYLVKEPEDFEKLLSLPYSPFEVSAQGFLLEERRLGDHGIVVHNLENAGYGLYLCCGSENLALFRSDALDLMETVIATFAHRIREHAKAVLAAGLTPVFGWVGPEVYLPPLMSPNDFHRYVFQFDKPLCDLIHDAGGYVWVHAHNKVADFINSFIEMGVDVLNPLEPPPNGDIDLEKTVLKYGNRIGWEGNIEIQEIIQSPTKRVRYLIDECVNAGAKSGRFILSLSSGLIEYPSPSELFLNNLKEYILYGYECVNKYN